MANENKLENVMLTGQSAYFKKSGSMTNHGSIELENALSSHSYDEGYIGPSSVLHGTDLAETKEYIQCESVMKSYLGDNWEENNNERTIITNSNKIKSMLEPWETNMQKLKDNITFDGTELEYIYTTESDAYIDTGINANSVYGIEFVFSPYSTSSDTYSNCSYLSGVLDNFTIGKYGTSSTKCYFRHRGTEYFTDGSVSTGTTATNTFTVLNNTVSINGTSKATLNTSLSLASSSGNIHIFNNSAHSRLAPMYFRGLKLYAQDQTTLLGDFIPCKDTDGTVCVYDKIRKKYIYNIGSGSFSAGKSLDTEHTELEYIETNGTQRIDLGLQAVSNSGFYIDFMPLEDFSTTESSGKKCIIAAGGNGVRSMFITTQPYINICSKPNYAKGSIQIGRNATPLDAKLIQYQRTQIELKNNILTLGNGDKITTEQGNPSNYAYWRLFNFYSVMGSVSAKAKVRFYGCKIYEGDTVVRDVIPVKDKFGIGCIYDKITDKLLYADINSDKIKLGPIKNS